MRPCGRPRFDLDLGACDLSTPALSMRMLRGHTTTVQRYNVIESGVQPGTRGRCSGIGQPRAARTRIFKAMTVRVCSTAVPGLCGPLGDDPRQRVVIPWAEDASRNHPWDGSSFPCLIRVGQTHSFLIRCNITVPQAPATTGCDLPHRIPGVINRQRHTSEMRKSTPRWPWLPTGA